MQYTEFLDSMLPPDHDLQVCLTGADSQMLQQLSTKHSSVSLLRRQRTPAITSTARPSSATDSHRYSAFSTQSQAFLCNGSVGVFVTSDQSAVASRLCGRYTNRQLKDTPMALLKVTVRHLH